MRSICSRMAPLTSKVALVLAAVLFAHTWEGVQCRDRTTGKTSTLSVRDMFPLRRGFWGMYPVAMGRKTTTLENIDGSDVIQVVYPQGSFKPSHLPQGGVQFVAAPRPIFPAEHVVFQYSVKFADSFQWVKGGKMPGLSIGTPGATGGHKNPRKASYRIMWGTDSAAVAYIYPPAGVNQVPEYSQQEGWHPSNGYGDGIWYNIMKFKKQTWNTVTLEVRLNTVVNGKPLPDGLIRLNINGVERSFEKIIWRRFGELKVHSVLFESFFGGGDPSFKTPVDTMTWFKDVSATKIA